MNYVPPRRSDGTLQRRRAQLPWPAGRPFRILSIDGGGICGILPASVLAELEIRYLSGRPIGQYFDMIAGTSTGGILSLGLAYGKSGRELRDFYLERGGVIFPPASPVRRLLRMLRRVSRHVYDSTALEEELLRVFGDTPLGAAKNRLCIPSFEGRHGEPWIYKTPHHPDYKKDRVERMVTVGLATSAAPTFLRALRNNGYVMVDGGLWANNPVMNALADALACFDVERDQIRICSLGCGEPTFKVDDAKAIGGLFQWRNVFLAAMRAQSMNVLGQAYLLVGRDNVVRVDAPETPMPIALDDYRRAKSELPSLAKTLVDACGHQIERMFLDAPLEPYTPCFGLHE